MIDFLVDIDKQLMLFINGMHNGFFDTIMWWFSSKTFWIPLYVAFLFFIIKQFKWKSVWIVLAIALVILSCDQISVVIKYAVARFRPSHDPTISNMLHYINNYHGGKYGFVSSHATNSFGLAVFLSMLFSKKYFTVFVILWAFLVSYSRIYLGVHFPGDVLFGALLGITLGFIIFKVLAYFVQFNSRLS